MENVNDHAENRFCCLLEKKNELNKNSFSKTRQVYLILKKWAYLWEEPNNR